MIPVPFLKGKRVVVMGLGASGTATARALLASGVGVMAWDDDDGKRRLLYRISTRGMPALCASQAA